MRNPYTQCPNPQKVPANPLVKTELPTPELVKAAIAVIDLVNAVAGIDWNKLYFDAGYNCYFNNRDENPWKSNTWQGRVWQTGWAQAQSEDVNRK